MTTAIQPAIPTELHGFRVEIGVGPYPPDQPKATGRAVYAKLHPLSPEIVKRMAYLNRTMVVAALPVAPHLADQIVAGDQTATEFCGVTVLAEASRLAKEIVG